ncbi:MAG TPA: hypothetical protein VK141_10515, partial [Nitrosomonas sp.]|nr:hypothetical protein [Nitrosomonas sp.]
MTIIQLSEKRKKWVDANRENGFDDGIKKLLTDLYPDNAHFIYELLQNAEDAGATQVTFILNEDNIEFEHNGNRLFSLADVDSITSIGVSTKKDDPTSIGKFGVGFKAVFAYTNTPEIQSGEYHFRIRDLVIPEMITPIIPSLGEKRTRFIFPFDNPKKSIENARLEIERNLRQLDENTLLFLSNIEKIEYLLPDSTMGCLRRGNNKDYRTEIIVQPPGTTEEMSFFFLRFEKMVHVHDDEGSDKSCKIAVAFSVAENRQQHSEESDNQKAKKNAPRWGIKPLKSGRVFIYFPAEKE